MIFGHSLPFYQSVFRLMGFRNYFFGRASFDSLLLSVLSARKDRHSGDKMRNEAKPLQSRIQSALGTENNERDSLPKLAGNFPPTNSSRFEILACAYSISKIKLLLLPTVYSSYINCLAAIADFSIFAQQKKPTAAASWKRTKWKETSRVLLRLVCE